MVYPAFYALLAMLITRAVGLTASTGHQDHSSHGSDTSVHLIHRRSGDSDLDEEANRLSKNLLELRQLMCDNDVQAIIIPLDEDDRLAWITGFTGSNGKAVVTADQATLWTDGRYIQQALQQTRGIWKIVNEKEPDELKVEKWLVSARSGLKSGQTVASDANLFGAQAWLELSKCLDGADISLVSLDFHLIDQLWTSHSERRKMSPKKIVVHPLIYAGLPWRDKVRDIRSSLEKMEISSMVISEPDEIAWLFNLRAEGATTNRDQVFSPLFPSLALLTKTHIFLWLHLEALTDDVRNHLSNDSDSSGDFVHLADYGQALKDLAEWATSAASDQKVLITKSFSHANWTELSAAALLERYRRDQALNRGLSFSTISAFGANAAIIHYSATAQSDTAISTSNVYLVDSGGQYLDGTTDVTRTFHFGFPDPRHIEMYTLVLMGAIDLARLTLPKGTRDAAIDLATRQHLFRKGLNYKHGSGHGIGCYLRVHEGPIHVTMVGPGSELQPNMFFSDEPGFYEHSAFGIRLETILRVVTKPDCSSDEYGDFIQFEPVTMVPFEPKLINYSLLLPEQIEWLNEYNKMIEATVGVELKNQGKVEALDWLKQRTKFVSPAKSLHVTKWL